MKLLTLSRRHIPEGISLKNPPSAIKLSRSDLVVVVRRNGFIIRDDDHPDDIIQFEPFHGARSLNDLSAMSSSGQSLSSFSGQQIYFGYKISKADDINASFSANYDFSVVSDSIDILGDYDKWKRENFPLRSQRPRHGKLDSLNSLKQEIEWIKKQSLSSELHKYSQVMMDIINAINYLNGTNDPGLQGGEIYNISSVSGLKEALGRIKTKSAQTVEPLLKASAIAFAKAVKDPQNNEEIKLREYIISKVLKKFTEFGKSYDLIVYPESKSSFNGELADRLAKSMGSRAVRVDKLADPTVNRSALGDRARRDFEARRGSDVKDISGNVVARGPSKGQEADPNWASAWEDKEARKLEGPEGSEIKRRFQDKRRYLNLFADPTDIDDDILLIDDNIDSGSTMEIIHGLLNQYNPSVLDMFTPFHMSLS